MTILAGLLGVLFQCLIKANGLKKDATIANLKFNILRDYIFTDYISISMSFLSVIVWQLLFSEVAGQYTQLEKFILCSFFVMGALGSYIIQLLLSVAKKNIRQAVDKKTDIADGKGGAE